MYNPDELLFCLCDPGPSCEGNLAWRYRLGSWERGSRMDHFPIYTQKNTGQKILKFYQHILYNIKNISQYFPKYNTCQYILKILLGQTDIKSWQNLELGRWTEWDNLSLLCGHFLVGCSTQCCHFIEMCWEIQFWIFKYFLCTFDNIFWRSEPSPRKEM